MRYCQPPSGGCVLKQWNTKEALQNLIPAAFGRLCVETIGQQYLSRVEDPAAFGRLCVETST